MDNDFGTYKGDTVHDMWVDYTAGQYAENSRGMYYVAVGNTRRNAPLSREQIQRRISRPATSVGQSKYRARCIREQIRRCEQSVCNLRGRMEHLTSKKKTERYRNRILETYARIHELEEQLKAEEQNGRKLMDRNMLLLALLLAAFCIIALIIACL